MNTARIRAVINITSLTYSLELSDPNSQEFIHLAESVKDAIESEYATVSGEQIVNVLQFR